MRRILIFCSLVSLLPMAAMAATEKTPVAPQVEAPAPPAAPTCLGSIASPAPSADQGIVPSPIWLSPCCIEDPDCGWLTCPEGKHPACGGGETGCGRCNCLLN